MHALPVMTEQTQPRWVRPIEYPDYSIERLRGFDIEESCALVITFSASTGMDPRVASSDIEIIRLGESFFHAKTIQQLIAEQGTQPITDFGVFAGAIPDDDVDDFVADIYRTRFN